MKTRKWIAFLFLNLAILVYIPTALIINFIKNSYYSIQYWWNMFSASCESDIRDIKGCYILWNKKF